MTARLTLYRFYDAAVTLGCVPPENISLSRSYTGHTWYVRVPSGRNPETGATRSVSFPISRRRYEELSEMWRADGIRRRHGVGAPMRPTSTNPST